MAADKISQALAALGLGSTAYIRTKYELPRRIDYLKKNIEEGKKGVQDEEIPVLQDIYRGLNTGLYDISGGSDTIKGQLNITRRTAGSVVDSLYKLQKAAYANYALAALPTIGAQSLRTIEKLFGGSELKPSLTGTMLRSAASHIPIFGGLFAPPKMGIADRAYMGAEALQSLASYPLMLAKFTQNINPITRMTSSASQAVLSAMGLGPEALKAAAAPGANWFDILKGTISPVASIGANILTYSLLNTATNKVGQWLMKPSFSVKKTFQLDRIPIISKYRSAEDFIDRSLINETHHHIMLFRDRLSPYEQLSLQLQAQIATSVATLPILTSEFINNFIEKRNAPLRAYNRTLEGLEGFLEGTSFNNVIQEQAFKLRRGENIHTLAQNIGLALVEMSGFMRKIATLTNIPAQIGMVLSGKKILEEANKYTFQEAQTEKLRKATYINQLGIQEVENFASAYMGIQQSSSEILARVRSAEEANIALLAGIYEASRVSALELATIRARGFRITEPINYNKIGRNVMEDYGGGLMKWLANYIPGFGAIYEATKVGQNVIRFILGKTKIGQLTLDAIEAKLEQAEQKSGGNILTKFGRGAARWVRTTMANPLLNRYHDRSYNLLASGFDYYRDTSIMERVTDRFLDRLNTQIGKIPILRQLFHQENRISLKEHRRMEYAEQVRGRVQEAAERIGLKQLEDQPLFYRYAVTEMPKQFDLMNFYLSGIFMFTQATMRNTSALAQSQGFEGYIAEPPKFKARVLDVYTGRLLTEKELKTAEEDRVRILAQAAEEIARMNEKALSRLERMIGNMRWLQGTEEDINRTRVKEIQKGIEESILYNITKEILTTDQLWQRQFRYSPATGVSMNIEEYEKSNPITATARKTFREYGSLRSAWYHFNQPQYGKITSLTPMTPGGAKAQELKNIATKPIGLLETTVDVNIQKVGGQALDKRLLPISVENFDFRDNNDLNDAFANFIRGMITVAGDIHRMAEKIAGPSGDNVIEGQQEAIAKIQNEATRLILAKEEKEKPQAPKPKTHSLASDIVSDISNILGLKDKADGSGKDFFSSLKDMVIGAAGAIFGGKILAGGAAKAALPTAGGFLARFAPGTLMSGGAASLLLNPYTLGAAAIGTASYGAYKLFHSGPDAKLIDKLEQLGAIDYNILGNSKILDWNLISKLSDKELNLLIKFDDWNIDDLRRLRQLQRQKYESIKSSIRLATSVFANQELSKEELKKKIENVKTQENIKDKIANALNIDKRVGKYILGQLIFNDKKTAELISMLDTAHIIDYSLISKSQILDWEEVSKLPVEDIDRLIKFDDWTAEDKKRLKEIRDSKEKYLNIKNRAKTFYEEAKNKFSELTKKATETARNVYNIFIQQTPTTTSTTAQINQYQVQNKPRSSATQSIKPISSTQTYQKPNLNNVELPVEGRLSSSYGWRIHPISHKRKFHKGIDIAAPTGTPVQAAMSGKVIRSEFSKWGWGNVITIQGDDGKKYLYAHLSARHVRVGDRVERGQTIGLVGSTGKSTGPHLHFQIMDEKGHTLDPIAYMKKLSSTAVIAQNDLPMENANNISMFNDSQLEKNQATASTLKRSTTLAIKTAEEVAAEETRRHLQAKLDTVQSLQDLYNKEKQLKNVNQLASDMLARAGIEQTVDFKNMSKDEIIEVLMQMKESTESLSAQQVQLLGTIVALLSKPENEISAKLAQSINGV